MYFVFSVENRSIMRELEGIAKLLDFLAKPEWSDHHVMVIMVISSMLEDLESLEVCVLPKKKPVSRSIYGLFGGE